MRKAMAEPCFSCSDGTELPVKVRNSTRAKNQRITLNNQGQLEVVFPSRVRQRATIANQIAAPSQREVEEFLEAHRAWIERAAKRTQVQREAYELSKAAGLPTHMEFPPIGELWLLEYQATSAKKVSLKRDGLRSVSLVHSHPNHTHTSHSHFKQSHTGQNHTGQNRFRLKLSGAVHDEESCTRALKRFVHQRAKETLPAFGWNVCDTVGAQPQEISVNSRKTAWGLCTHDGTIKLDRKLLFLPRDLAVQVVLHEIAHLQQMDHSKRFYEQLFALDGSSKEAERALKAAMTYIPAWLR